MSFRLHFASASTELFIFCICTHFITAAWYSRQAHNIPTTAMPSRHTFYTTLSRSIDAASTRRHQLMMPQLIADSWPRLPSVYSGSPAQRISFCNALAAFRDFSAWRYWSSAALMSLFTSRHFSILSVTYSAFGIFCWNIEIFQYFTDNIFSSWAEFRAFDDCMMLFTLSRRHIKLRHYWHWHHTFVIPLLSYIESSHCYCMPYTYIDFWFIFARVLHHHRFRWLSYIIISLPRRFIAALTRSDDTQISLLATTILACRLASSFIFLASSHFCWRRVNTGGAAKLDFAPFAFSMDWWYLRRECASIAGALSRSMMPFFISSALFWVLDSSARWWGLLGHQYMPMRLMIYAGSRIIFSHYNAILAIRYITYRLVSLPLYAFYFILFAQPRWLSSFRLLVYRRAPSLVDITFSTYH